MLSSHAFNHLRRLQLRTKKNVQSLIAGSYDSAFRGSGLSFDEVREYEPGDDIRTIDWNVTARVGRPYIKRFVEERELTILLLIDLSGSQRYGLEKSKQSMTLELAALIALAAVYHRDRVGLIGFTDRVELHVHAGQGNPHALTLLRKLMAVEPVGTRTDLISATENLQRAQKRRATVFIISDFIDPNLERYQKTLRKLSYRHDVIAIRTMDRREIELPRVGLAEFQDPETGEIRLVDTSNARFQQWFAAEAAARDQRYQRLVRSCGVDSLDLKTDDDFVSTFVRFLQNRHRKS